MKCSSLVLVACLAVLGCDDNKESSKDAASKSDDGKTDEPKPEPKQEPIAKTDDPPPTTDEAPKLADLDPPPEPAAIEVQLPPSADFDAGAAPLKHSDGVLSIAGLRADLAKNVADGDRGIEVEVRGTIQEIYVPPECPAGEVCVPGKQPHLWIVDDPADRGKRNAMLVVNYRFQIPEWEAKRWAGQPEPVMEVDREYTIRGKFRLMSDSGFAHDRGLLEFVALKDGTEWIFPPGAAFHPLEVARQEEENAALLKKVSE